MSCRAEFVQLASQPESNIRELCRRFEISPKTAYKWLARYRQQGPSGLQDRSRQPLHSPRRSSAELEARVLALHARYPCWGARKLYALLEPGPERPHPSTIDAILRRHGCRLLGASGQQAARQRFEHEAPNQLWQMDFKGHFLLSDARAGRCHPLTLIDDHSRYLLCLKACAYQTIGAVQPLLADVFRRYGLPERISADNGPPWGSRYPGSLTELEVWFMRLGIRLSHSRPLHPQTQGKLERLHRTLKRELLSYQSFSSLASCQSKMDRWRQQYNQIRPHQALDWSPPIARYRPSARRFPEQLPTIEYEPQDHILKVTSKGQVRHHRRDWYISHALAGLPVALRPTPKDGLWDVIFIQRYICSINLHTPQ